MLIVFFFFFHYNYINKYVLFYIGLVNRMKKFLVVVEISNNFDNISRCIDSIIKQSFHDFDVLIINPYDDDKISNLLLQYEKTDNRVSVINDRSLSTIHDIRVCGFENCNASFITFIKSDDYLSCDYLRLMNDNIDEFGSLISIANYICDDSGYRFGYTFTDSLIKKMSSDEAIDDFFDSCGNNKRLYLFELKCICSSVFKKIFDDYKRLNVCSNIDDDIILSIMLNSSSSNVSFVDSCLYFYNYSNDVGKFHCDFLKNYMSKKSLKKYIKFLNNWDVNYDGFYSSCYEYNDGLEQIKNHIINDDVDVISFDMFDTLVVRPFYKAFDLFELMDKEFINLSKKNPVIKFSKIRKDSEAILRDVNNSKNIEEVRIEDIYKYIHDFYDISSSILKRMQSLEESLEVKFCTRRETGFDLYRLAKSLGKKVIVITDMYLSMNTICAILDKNGYSFDDIYLSSEILKTKQTGSLFKYVIDNEKASILHIGDNVHSDVSMALNNGIASLHLPRAIDVFMGDTDIKTNNCGRLFEEFDMYNINVNAYLKNSCVRSSIALIANKYFDNPFKNFIGTSKFNCDPFLIGYYALGMHLLSLSKWILSDTKNKCYDSISFMSRDGYLPLKSSLILQENTDINNDIVLNYVYISRKAMLPLLFSTKNMINIFQTYIDYRVVTPEKLCDLLSCVLKDYEFESVSKIFIDNSIELDFFKTKNDFFKCLSLIYDKLFDKEKYNSYLSIVKNYFEKNFVGSSATFDIGYSGKPESLISFILGKSISTYFYHTTSSEAYFNSFLSNYELNTFYDFMPTLTGTIRELFYSDTIPSCVGYSEKNGEVIPIFDNVDGYTYFNKKIIKTIQNSALSFVDDFSKLFGDYFDYFDFNRFYMSIPYEFFNHYIDDDRIVFKDLVFESNVNDSKLFTDYIDDILDDYKYYNKNFVYKVLDNEYNVFRQFMCDRVKNDLYDELKNEMRMEIEKDVENELLSYGYTVLPKNRFSRIIYYVLFDNKKLLKKIKKKFKK